MDKIDLKKLSSLSPFELKNYLIDIASRNGEQMMLNAGRGNPNFLATEPRHGFFQMGLFAMSESELSLDYLNEGFGGLPDKNGIEARFYDFISKNDGISGIDFLKKMVSYVRDHMGISAQDFLYETCVGILGCSYPVPDRMLKIMERVIGEYIRKEMIGDKPFKGGFDMFAVEGGTAAMTYVFNTLKENRILNPGDSIALGLPIFTPYIDIPVLNDYKLVEVNIESETDTNWQYPKAELDKLLDPKVKAFFIVNPSNPPSVKINDESLNYLVEIVKKRPDLIILTDDVYGTFADNFTSLFAVCPQNTILVYSFSKYFGATGWRLGVIATHNKNIIDDMIQKKSGEIKNEMIKRYKSISPDPTNMKFIDRLVADSRAVALNHTAGLATTAQVQMMMFSVFALMDNKDEYKAVAKQLLHRRKAAMYSQMNTRPVNDPNAVDYYHLFDYKLIATGEYGKDFADWLLKNLKPDEFVFALAEKTGVVLLPGQGFGTTHPSARVSLANLLEVQYKAIGKATDEIMSEYYEKYKKSK